jgi:DNA-binding GntR family transcriptional regulator
MSLAKARAGPPAPAAALNVRAYTLLRDAILAGRLPPGTPLSRRRLAEAFSMSTLPVADALSRLESEGLVESRPRAGTRVRIPSAQEVHGNYVVREALETHSARLFAELASAEDRRRLLKLAADLDRRFAALGRTRTPDPDRHAAVELQHRDFHMLIAEATGCPELAAAIERSRVLLFNWLFMSTGDYVPLPNGWHAELADALVHGTPDRAAETMRMHVRYRKEAVVAKFQRLLADDAERTRPLVRGPRRGSKNGGPRDARFAGNGEA